MSLARIQVLSGGVSLQGVLRVWGFGVSGRVGLMG